MAQPPLFTTSHLPRPPRPSERDPSIRRRAANEIASQLIGDLPDDFKDRDREKLIADLLTIRDRDGFEIGKRLDRDGWTITAFAVEILDSFGAAVDEAVDEAVREWTTCYQFVPRFSVGDHVRIASRFRSYDLTLLKTVFTIREVSPATMGYTIYSTALGHLTDADRDAWRSGTIGIHIHDEDLELAILSA